MTTFLTWMVIATIIGGVLYVVSRYAALWLRAWLTGTGIGLFSLISMSLRKIDPQVIVHCKVMAV